MSVRRSAYVCCTARLAVGCGWSKLNCVCFSYERSLWQHCIMRKGSFITKWQNRKLYQCRSSAASKRLKSDYDHEGDRNIKKKRLLWTLVGTNVSQVPDHPLDHQCEKAYKLWNTATMDGLKKNFVPTYTRTYSLPNYMRKNTSSVHNIQSKLLPRFPG
jgi:hypothetical protein